LWTALFLWHTFQKEISHISLTVSARISLHIFNMSSSATNFCYSFLFQIKLLRKPLGLNMIYFTIFLTLKLMSELGNTSNITWKIILYIWYYIKTYIRSLRKREFQVQQICLFLYRWTVHFVVYFSNTPTNSHIYIVFNNLKFTLKHLKRSYMSRSHDHPQGAEDDRVIETCRGVLSVLM